MNIFVLNENPFLAAHDHCDKHVNKMLVETLQMLASTHWYSLGITKKSQITEDSLEHWKTFPRESAYGIGFMNHPCTKWIRQSIENWRWTIDLCTGLHDEYDFRYGKQRDRKILNWFESRPPEIPSTGLTPFVMAMPEQAKTADPVHSYRLFYAGWKEYFAKWKTEEPTWWKEYKELSRSLDIASDKVRLHRSN